MIELFKQIIIGEKNVDEINNISLTNNIRIRHSKEVAKIFLKNASIKYRMGHLKKDDIDDLIFKYSLFVQNNTKVKNYINSSIDNDNMEDVYHEVVVFLDNFKNINVIKEEPKVYKKELSVKGYVQPMLLAIITLLSCLLFLGNLYLNM